MGVEPARAVAAAARRVTVAVVAGVHLVALPGARALVFEPALVPWLAWFGVVPMLLLLAGRARALALATLSGLLATGAAVVLHEGQDPVALLASLTVLAALSLVALGLDADRLSLDRWRSLRDAPLDALATALRTPVVEPREPRGRVLLRLCVGGALLLTGVLAWITVPLVTDRVAALARVLGGLVFVLPLGALHARGVRRAHLLVLYDENCHFCSRTLQWMRALDPAATWELRSDRDLPARVLEAAPALAHRDALYVLEGERSWRGYHAVRRLFTPYPALGAVVFVMGLPPVAWVGERIYAEVARRRNEWFACAVDRGDANSTDA